MYSAFRNARCNICNSVSHSEIASDHGDFYPGLFYPDPGGFGYVCSECYSEINDVRLDYALQDEELVDSDEDEFDELEELFE